MSIDCTLLLADAVPVTELRAHLVAAGGVQDGGDVWLSADRSAAALAEPRDLDAEQRQDMKVFRIDARSMVKFYWRPGGPWADQVARVVSRLAQLVAGDFVLVFVDKEILRRRSGEVTVRKAWRDQFGHLATHHAVAAK